MDLLLAAPRGVHGHPLYHYAKDSAAGQLNGEGAKDQFGEWYLATPAGDALESD